MMAFGVNFLTKKLDARTYKAALTKAMHAPSLNKVGMRGSAQVRMQGMRSTAERAAKTAHASNLSTARKAVYGGMAGASAASFAASRPKANESRTSYRGPMQTGRGIGRYS